MSINQLKLVLGFKDDNFNNIFVDLCQKELDKKKGKSLDFFDLSNLIDKSIQYFRNKNKINLFKCKFLKDILMNSLIFYIKKMKLILNPKKVKFLNY